VFSGVTIENICALFKEDVRRRGRGGEKRKIDKT
jgi:hypothetical protein